MSANVTGLQAGCRFPSHFAATDGDLRAFLATTARYLLAPRDLIALGRLDEEALDEIGLTAAEFDAMLAEAWRNHETRDPVAGQRAARAVLSE